MSSSVFFRFKSQKDPSRVAFDGTGISVFELKREIISISKLGDGTDFELQITSEDGGEEYDDDTAIVPRSTTVIAKRTPAAKAGRGGSARYVSGRMPANAKNSHRREGHSIQQSMSTSTIQPAIIRTGETEDERIKAMFKMGADQWAQDQEQMANVTPVHRGASSKGKPQNLPDHTPPPGYICYRCGEKGHWIQACPTNNDPTFDGRPRVKRTTGIPRSFLKTVEKPAVLANDGTVDDAKHPSGIMVNAEGEWVIAEPDKAAWEKFQAKAKVSTEAQDTANQGSKELQEQGLECSIDKRLFVNPVKTPCCKKTFCFECITNALLDNDLRCPECSTEDVPIDNLLPDADMVDRIHQYDEEKAAKEFSTQESISKIKSEPPEDSQNRVEADPDLIENTEKLETQSKKRPADSELENDHKPNGPSESAIQQMLPASSSIRDQSGSQPKPTTAPNPTSSAMIPAMNAMMMPNMNNFMNMANMNGLGANPIFNPAMMMMQDPSFYNMNPGLWGPTFPQQGLGMPNGFQNVMMPNGGMVQQNVNHINAANGLANMNRTTPNVSNGMNGANVNGQRTGPFANQQRSGFGNLSGNSEEGAYFRKPVNPHRHQARRNVNRPTDYREL